MASEAEKHAKRPAGFRPAPAPPEAPDVPEPAAEAETPFPLGATHLDPTSRRFHRPARESAPPVVDPLPPGIRTLGGYRLLRKLGEGGMGAVYLAYQEGQERQVALKVLAEGMAANRAYVDRFYREARSGTVLSHVNIVRNFAVGQDADTGLHFLVLEYVDGPSARELLDRFGRLSAGDAVHIALDVARALEHAHSRNIVHRDIKPDNILLTRSGVAKLADLGLAKQTDEVSHLTATRQGFGTPHYMPYEQAMNARYADGRSDIYALGATLYHLLTGEVPFPAASQVEIIQKKDVGFFIPAGALNPEVSPVLEAILAKMLARDPAARYQTASELIIDLLRCGLAAPVPSFADPALALHDPLVRQSLAEQVAPTCLDVRVRPAAEPEEPPTRGVWFLRYRGGAGQWCKVRTTTEKILKRLRDGRLPTDAEAAAEARGPFQPLTSFAEFQPFLARPVPRPSARRRDGEIADAPVSAARGSTCPRWWLLLGIVGLSLFTLGAVVMCKVFAGTTCFPN
jgi:serine/threonine protein kinase